MRVGQHVICVDDSILPGKEIFVKYTYPQWVKKDQEYIIREILENDGIVEGILLEEIINPEIYIKLLGRKQEPAFRTSRFRTLSKITNKIEENLTESIIEITYNSN